MRKSLLLMLLLLVPASLFAQNEPWRNRPSRYGAYADNYFELTPFLGYRYGGTIFADQSSLFNRDVKVESAANFGVNFAIPISNGMKVELMVNRQDTHFTSGVTQVNLGPGLMVSAVQIASPTSLTATVTVSATAAIGMME